jgi:hypothetical protein
MNKYLFSILVSWMALHAYGDISVNHTTDELGRESISADLRSGGLDCYDRQADQGFGAVPGELAIEGSKLFDRTLRLSGVERLTSELPDEVNCQSLTTAIAQLPQTLYVQRVLTREVAPSWDKKRLVSQLVAHFSVSLPIKVGGKDAVLTGETSWLEENSDAADPQAGEKPFPKKATFTVLTYPQSGTEGVGLFCQAAYSGAEKSVMTLGEFSGNTSSIGPSANATVLNRPFADAATCEDARNLLLETFTAEDPGNWGELFKVNRNLEIRHRYILDNQGHPQCQEIELETSAANVRGYTMRAARAFMLRTIALAECQPDHHAAP